MDYYLASYFPFVVVFLFGLIIGSFINCLIWRLYRKETLGGRSYCPHCRHTIAWYDNVPVLSFMLLGGHCRHCRQKISWQYPLVEIITAVLFLLIFRLDILNPDFVILLLRDWLLAITMIIVFVYDWRWQLVPMSIVWPMTTVMFVLNILLGTSWLTMIFFGLAATIFFLVQYLITKKRGVGEGDIWLGLFLGLTFPAADKLLFIMVVSYTLGAIVGLILISQNRKDWKSRLAFGPFLMTGAIIALIWGEKLLAWYWEGF